MEVLTTFIFMVNQEVWLIVMLDVTLYTNNVTQNPNYEGS